MKINPFAVEIQKSIGGIGGIGNVAIPTESKGTSGSFASELQAKLQESDRLQHDADAAMQEGAVNGANNIHETMIRLEEADISLRLVNKVRSKALDAYHEMMRMQF